MRDFSQEHIGLPAASVHSLKKVPHIVLGKDYWENRCKYKS